MCACVWSIRWIKVITLLIWKVYLIKLYIATVPECQRLRLGINLTAVVRQALRVHLTTLTRSLENTCPWSEPAVMNQVNANCVALSTKECWTVAKSWYLWFQPSQVKSSEDISSIFTTRKKLNKLKTNDFSQTDQRNEDRWQITTQNSRVLVSTESQPRWADLEQKSAGPNTEGNI